MPGFLRNLDLDRLSFWIGFLAGSLFWWFLGLLRPLMRRGWIYFKNQLQLARQGMTEGIETRLRNDTIRLAQGLHLAAPLFSLDEILVQPRLLAPAPRVEPGADQISRDIVANAIPYLPEWPELAATYSARTLTLPQALQAGANLAIIGQPGSGKTVALADLACMVARRDPGAGELSDLLPIYVHAGDLSPSPEEIDEPLSTLLGALAIYASSMTVRGLPKLMHTAFDDGRALLLFDGLDELPRAQVDEQVLFLKGLLKHYPKIRAVAAASTDYYDGLTHLGLIPIPMAAWGDPERRAFTERWGDLWTQFVDQEIWRAEGPVEGETRSADPLLIQGWLSNERLQFTPLELTFKVWAAYAGDMLGPSATDAIEAYLRRMTVQTPNARPALEQLALQMTLTESPAIARREAGSSVAIFDDEGAPLGPAEEQGGHDPKGQRQAVRSRPVSIRRTLPDLLAGGLLVNRADSRVAFAHPVLQGFLCGRALARAEGKETIASQPEWAGKSLSLQFLAACGEASQMALQMLESSTDPLQKDSLIVGRWLRTAPRDAGWRALVMRRLAKLIQNETYSLGLRCRALAALALSGDPEVAVLFRHLLGAPHAYVRQMGALACGWARDGKSVNDLAASLGDPTPNVRRAACLALVNIGTSQALDAVASALLHGDEGLRRAAAEAFANHPEEGHPALREGAGLDDLLVRRAVVFGLQRLGQDWAIELLEKMQLEDQWVVRNAANQALEELRGPDPHIPRPFPELHETPWLIAFASERGLGVTSGRAAQDMLELALREGDNEQRLGAMETMRQFPPPEVLPTVYHLLYGDDWELREAALNLLWHMDAAGIELPDPAKFGLG